MSRMQSNIAYSMGKARRSSLGDKEAKKLPGPGIYKQTKMDAVKHQNPSWSMKGKGVGEKFGRDGPGPGQYSDKYKKNGSPNYSFGGKMSKTFYPDTSNIPGPGSYSQKSSLRNKGGYIGSRHQEKRKKNVPGPGQYSMRSTFGGRGATFGSGGGKTGLIKVSKVPGPGQYKVDSSFGNKTQGGGFGSGRVNRATYKGPGPGQYSVNDGLYRDMKAASLKGRPKTSKEDMKPGPGHYQSKSMHNSPAFTMGVKTKLKKLVGKDQPGPGNYNPDYKRVKQGAPGMLFGTPIKERMIGDSSMPGPGQYDISKKAGSEAPAYGMKGRYKEAQGDMKPGPGNYNPKEDFTQYGTPGMVMGSGKRSDFASKSQAPGPGQYPTKDRIGEGSQYSFGAGERNDGSLERRAKAIPGPGQYTQSSFMGRDSQGKTIAGKGKDRRPDQLPGPGAYKVSANRNGPAFSLSGHRTEDPILREKAKMPPPGTYNPNDKSVAHGTPGVVFGDKPKVSFLKGDGVPGPGQYNAKSTLEGKGILIAGKSPEKIIDRSPGPGKYMPNADPQYTSGPAFTIGGINGDQSIPTRDVPGPGTYESPERPATSGFSFGGDKRKGLGEKKDAPGPGQYTIPSRVGNEGKGVLIAGRYENKVDTNQVGPGQYKMPSSIGGPKFSMGAGEKGMKLNKNIVQNPPPGTYSVDPNVGKNASPGVVFGKDSRGNSRAEAVPGPGNYAIPSTIENKGITIQGRHDEKVKERAPGPGTYKQEVPPNKTHGGNIRFGNEVRGKMPKDSGAPGPGQYKIDMKYEKGPIMGKDLRDKNQKSDMPGPGQYNTRAQEGLTYY